MKCAESNDGSSDKRDAEHPDSTLEVAHCPGMTVRFHHVIFIRPAKQGLAVNRKFRPKPESRCARFDQQECRDINGGARTASPVGLIVRFEGQKGDDGFGPDRVSQPATGSGCHEAMPDGKMASGSHDHERLKKAPTPPGRPAAMQRTAPDDQPEILPRIEIQLSGWCLPTW